MVWSWCAIRSAFFIIDMRVLLVGSGGREHALAKAIACSRQKPSLFCIGSNAGIAQLATMVQISLDDHASILAYAQEQRIDFAVIGPDAPLVAGLVDVLEAGGIPSFGPTKQASRLEGSKSYAKAFLARHRIPTPAYQVFSDFSLAMAHVASCPLPVVIKADGLALGKGVVIAYDRETAKETLKQMMVQHVFGDSGATIVIEEFVSGMEVSLLAFTDGKHCVPMVSAMDHKRAWDGDEGPNTGGMGVIAPNPFYTEAIQEICMSTIIEPTIRSMQEEGNPFVGCLFFGLMLTSGGPVVIEYNCRFGDPEAQAVLALLKSDLLTILLACRNGSLTKDMVQFSDQSACSVTVASKGYPNAYSVHKLITVQELPNDVSLVHAATTLDEKKQLYTNGGRVLHVVAVADTLEEAVRKAYAGVSKVSFAGMEFRTDIGAKALYKEK